MWSMGSLKHTWRSHEEYEDIVDCLDTLLEEGDPEFQKSLKQAARQVKRGRYLTHTDLKLAVADKKIR
jgi:hypothetical protein